MATILICPLHETGHLIPTFPIARALRDRGHRVVYAAILDLEPAVAAQGFEYLPILRDVYRKGHGAMLDATDPADAWTLQRMLWQREYEDLFSGRELADMEAVAPDLMLIDVTNVMLAMAARSRGIRCLHYTTSMSQVLDDDVPPLTTAMPFDAPPVQREAAKWARGCLPVWGSWHFFEHAFVRFACGPHNVTFSTCIVPEVLDVPNLVLPPAALDFPRPPGRAPLHAGVPVDLERAELVPSDLERFLDERPLVYVSLGSQSHRFAEAEQLFRTVIDALRGRPDWQAVIAAGRLAGSLATDRPDNVFVMERSPQIWALRHAAVFVTHAGMGAVREAISLGVPMVVIPLLNDGHGNAARIEYHQLGIHLPHDVVDVRRLTSCIARVLRDRAGYADRLLAMERACAAEIAEQPAVRMIERVLAEPVATPALESPLVRAKSDTNAYAVGWVFVRAAGEPSAVAVTPDGVVPSLGRDGYTVCTDLGHALARADGCVLARVALSGDLEHAAPHVTGRRLTWSWHIDATQLLEEFALHCLREALAEEREQHPEIVEFFVDAFARHRAGTDQRAALERVGGPRAHRGYAVALEALDGPAHIAAFFARDMLILARCRSATLAADGSPETYMRARPEVIRAIDAQLTRAVEQVASARGLPLTP